MCIRDSRQTAGDSQGVDAVRIPGRGFVEPGLRPWKPALKGTEQAGRSLGITIVSVHFPERSDAERAFTEIRRAKAKAVTVLSDPVTVARRLDITEMAVRYRVPAIYALREWVEDGGLISYATSLNEQWRRAARYVDKILKLSLIHI